MSSRSKNHSTYRKLQEAVLAHRSAWIETRKWLTSEERQAKEDPHAFVSVFVPYVLRQRRHIRRVLLRRFGVKVNYHRRFEGDKAKYPGLFGEQYLAFPERFPLRFHCCPEDHALYLWYRSWSDLLYWFDGAWAVIVAARAWAAREGKDPDTTVVEDVIEYHRKGPWIATPTRQTEPDPVLRQQYAQNLAGWVGAHLNLRLNKRVRDALDALKPSGGRHAKLLEELLPATVIAYDQLRTADSIAAPGSGKRNLVSETAKVLAKLGKEARLALGGKIPGERSETAIPDGEDSLKEFELHETFYQDPTLLNSLVGRAALSELETRVLNLDMETNYDTVAIAYELSVKPGTVRVLRKRYTDKLRKAAGS